MIEMEERIRTVLSRQADAMVVPEVHPERRILSVRTGETRPIRGCRPPGSRRTLVAALSVAAAVVAAGMLVVEADPPRTSPAATSSSSPPTSTDSTSAPHRPTAPQLEWAPPVAVSSMDGADIIGLVAGPAGFVATGMGLQPGRNDGRVWFSANGATWVEVQYQTFEAMGLAAPVATSNAFWIAAVPNRDRSDAPDVPGQLYRSTDGINWASVGAPADGVELGSVLAAGPLLFAEDISRPGTVIVSRDGRNWHAAAGLGPMTMHTATYVGGVAYLLGLAPGGAFDLWSTTDGTDWRQLSAPPDPGQLFELGGSLAVNTDPKLDDCMSVKPDEVTAGGIDDIVAAQRACRGTTAILTYGAAGSWEATASGLESGPSWAPVAPLPGGAVRARLTLDGTLELASTADADDWSSHSVSALAPREHQTPAQPLVAANARHVVAIASTGLGGNTVLVPGIVR